MKFQNRHDSIVVILCSTVPITSSEEKGMNPILDAIKKRRSVRSHESRTVSKEIMAMITEAGNRAPSAMNTVNPGDSL